MNDKRRKKLNLILKDLEILMSDIKILRDEEQEYYDSLSESLQDSEKGKISQTAIEIMENAMNNIEKTIDYGWKK
jgi:hypothetical protein